MTVIDVGRVQMSELKTELGKVEADFRERGLTTNNWRLVLSELLTNSLQKTYKSQKGNVKLVRGGDEPGLFEGQDSQE